MKINYLNKKLLLVIVLLAFVMSSVAQNRNRERIKLLKISYISNAIDLTTSEAEKFWPIYNKHEKNIRQLKNQLDRFNTNADGKTLDLEAISPEKAEEVVLNLLKTESEISTIKKQMVNELSSVISFKKILKLQKAERDFNRRMLQEFGKRRRMNGQ